MANNYEEVNSADEKILNNLMNDERYEHLKNYEINVKMFYKYGKYDKEGNLKTPALQKNGIPVPAVIKLVSAFNRITDDTDAKIVINRDLWDELTETERISTIDNLLYMIQIKEDKIGEPLYISEDSNKVQLKLRKPDFFIEGFLDLLNLYKKEYLPWKDAANISTKLD